MILTKEARRLGIFFFYDKDGIADEYIFFYLKSILPYLNKLLIVCNGKLTVSSRTQLESLEKTTVLVRENRGFDVWAYKTGIEYFGFDNIIGFDELIMFNFTIMGPVYSLQEMFNDMNGRDVDFWGLTIHNGAPFDPWGLIKEGIIPVHIQSHFIAIRKKMLSSFEFKEYWENMPMISCYEEAVSLHEAIFTKKFEEKGYKWDVYVDTKDLLNETYYPMFNMPVELIRDRKCPFFKRKLFIYDWNDLIDENGAHAAAELYKYIKEESDYSIDLIEKHILRTGNLNLFLNAINSRFIVSDLKSKYYEKEKVAFIISIEPNTHYYYKPYIEKIPEDIICYFFVPEELMDNVIPENGNTSKRIYIKKNLEFPETQWIELLQKVKDKYDYICNLCDITGDYTYVSTNIRSFAKVTFDCMIKSENYISEIIDLFEKNKNLGILIPMAPIHSVYYGINGNEWGGQENYKIICSVLKTFKCDVPISYDIKPIVSLSGCMWFKTESLKTLIEYKNIRDIEKKLHKKIKSNEDIPHLLKTLCNGMKYTWAYIAQKEGFYSSYICPQTIAANMIVNYDNSIAKINYDFQNVSSLHEFLFNQNMDFIKIAINMDCGSGYLDKNIQSEIIIRKMYSVDNISATFKIEPDSKEISISIAEGLMCICKNIQFNFLNEDGHLTNIAYRIFKNADFCTKDGLDIFFSSSARYKLRGNFNNANSIKINFEKLIVIPFIKGAENIFKRRTNCKWRK